MGFAAEQLKLQLQNSVILLTSTISLTYYHKISTL